MEELLTRAIQEITNLRRHNEIMSAQLAIVDVFVAVVGLKKESGGMTIDIVWEIQKKIDELKCSKGHNTQAEEPVRRGNF